MPSLNKQCFLPQSVTKTYKKVDKKFSEHLVSISSKLSYVTERCNAFNRGKVHVAPCWNSDARLVNAQNRYTLKMYNKARLNLLFDNERK